MLTLRIDQETEQMIGYLKDHNVKYTDIIRGSIKESLAEYCKEFKRKPKRESNVPEWAYD